MEQAWFTQAAQETDFLAALLALPSAEIVAEYTTVGLDDETMAVPSQTLQRVIQQLTDSIYVTDFEESLFYDIDGRRLVCRLLSIQQKTVILIVLIKANETYKRKLNRLCKTIEEHLS